jgi:hypothetical protein
MAKLKWKQSRVSYKVFRAFATRGLGGGVYEICDDGKNGCEVTFSKKRRAMGIGTTSHRREAEALAQAHNDERLQGHKRRREEIQDGDAPF